MQKANLSPETLRAKKRVHVAVSCVLLTVVLSTLIFLFPTGIMATCCVIFAGIFFCLAAVSEYNFNIIILIRMFCYEVVYHCFGYLQNILVSPHFEAYIFTVRRSGSFLLFVASASRQQASCHERSQSERKNSLCFHKIS